MTYNLSASESEWNVTGKGKCGFNGGVISARDAFAERKGLEIGDFELRFSARAPGNSPQTDIWASFRRFSRDYHYMVGLRGSNHNHLYLSRLGAEGYDKMLALCPLDFTVMPGVWYDIRVVCAGSGIAVWLGDEEKPRILARDPDSPFSSGTVAFGGYYDAEYRDIVISEAPENALDGVAAAPDYLQTVTLPPELKEAERRRARALYRPCAVPKLPDGRLELNLEGRWLFIPENEVKGDPSAFLCDDSAAHTIRVPECWIPLQAWLEGETYGEDNMNKGQSDSYWLEEFGRCMNYTFDWNETQRAWYRHYIDLPEGIGDKKVEIDFEGIALVSEIYINGHKARENIGMFTPMRVDLSEYVHAGRNTLAVMVSRVLTESAAGEDTGEDIDEKYAKARESGFIASDCEHRPFNTDDLPHGFYTNHPGGIWRPVKLIISDRLSVSGCWFRPSLDGADIEVTVSNGEGGRRGGTLSYSIVHHVTGGYLCGGEIASVSLGAGESGSWSFRTPKVSPILWEPGKPNLYDLTFVISRDGRTVDSFREKVGFRTVAVSGSRLIFNGRPIWVRGGNHMPAHVKPNDARLAETFIRMALDHNVIATRTHVAPWTDAWLDAADENGLMVSLEGTWSWLMLSHIPSDRSLEIWKSELRQLYLRHRNRPSLFMITMNNEMNFYLTRGSDETVREKGWRVQDGIRTARSIFPDLPLVCDSGYNRSPTLEKSRDLCFPYANGRYERVTRKNGFDDGDIDDPHFYYGWYDKDFYHFMRGEFGWQETLSGRPCLLQECSVGYCRDEDGHAVRFYLYAHQVPQTTTGKRAYEHNSPEYFQHNHAFQVKGLAETFRRVEHERVCGILMFAYETWFYHHCDALRIQPMLSAERLKTAYQPVLVCAELYCRHFYAGRTLTANVSIINDDRERDIIKSPTVEVSVVCGGYILASETVSFGDIPYFGTASAPASLLLPKKLPGGAVSARLVLRAVSGGETVSLNDYEITAAEEEWADPPEKKIRAICLDGDAAAISLLSAHHIPAETAESVPDQPEDGERLVIAMPLDQDMSEKVHRYAAAGGKAVMVNQRDLSPSLCGREIVYTEDATEIVTMNVPESRVFAGLGEYDTSWFDNGFGIPYAAYGRYSVDRFDRSVTALAETLHWHSYIGKPTDYKNSGGTPLFAVRFGENGGILVSSLRTDADAADPVACRLTDNILTWDFTV